MLQVLTNIYGQSDWNHCFVVPDVDLPTGYYLGMSAATGELAGIMKGVTMSKVSMLRYITW